MKFYAVKKIRTLAQFFALLLFMSVVLFDIQTASAKLNEYSNEITKNFMGACFKEGGKVAYCKCALDKIRERFTESEYIKQETLMMVGKASDELANTMVDARTNCRN